MVIFHSYVGLPEGILYGKSPRNNGESWENVEKISIMICCYLVGGAISILKNDGVRQWEG